MKLVEIILNFTYDETGILIDIIRGVKQIVGNKTELPKLSEGFVRKGLLWITSDEKSGWNNLFKHFDSNQTRFSAEQVFLISDLRDKVQRLS